eukprot:4726573-Pleurochrysis_carterae.AAC.3
MAEAAKRFYRSDGEGQRRLPCPEVDRKPHQGEGAAEAQMEFEAGMMEIIARKVDTALLGNFSSSFALLRWLQRLIAHSVDIMRGSFSPQPTE